MLEDRTKMGNEASRDPGEPFSSPPELYQLVGNVKILEEWYASNFRRRIAEITELLSTQISKELRTKFEQERHSVYVQVDDQSGTTIESLRNEIAQLRTGSRSNDGLSEIGRIEKQINEIEAELEHSFTMDSVPLSRLLQLRTKQSDLKSYLRGLKFFAGTSAAETILEEETSFR